MRNTNEFLTLTIHVLGIYLFYIIYGYYQEKLLTQTYGMNKFTYFSFLALLHNIGGTILSIIMSKRNNTNLSLERPLLFDYFKCSFLKLFNLMLSYRAAENISYPALIIGRSCKVIPILIMNYVIYNKRYHIKKYIAAFLLTLGILLFMFKSSEVSEKSNQFIGLLFLSITLISDGSLNAIQDYIFKKYKVSSYHMMFYLNLISAVIGFFICLFGNEIVNSFIFIVNAPIILVDLICYSTFNVIGQLVIYSMLEKFGSVTLTSVTITRKLFTILFSIIIFKHSVSNLQCFGLFLVFFSFLIDLYDKNKTKTANKNS